MPSTRRQFLAMTAGAGLPVMAGCTRGGEPVAAPGLRLPAAPLTLDLAGHEAPTWGYGGVVPGPEIRVPSPGAASGGRSARTPIGSGPLPVGDDGRTG